MILNIILVVLLSINLGILLLVYINVRSEKNVIKREDLDILREQVTKSEQEIRSEVKTTQVTNTKALAVNINELSKALTAQLENRNSSLVKAIGELGEAQDRQLQDVRKATNDLTESNRTSIENVRGIVDKRLQAIQESNEKKTGSNA